MSESVGIRTVVFTKKGRLNETGYSQEGRTSYES
jgi:hypothetical protein